MYREETKMKVDVKELDLNILPPNFSNINDKATAGYKACICGRSGSGKSTIIKSLLYEKSAMFPCGLVMSGTEDTNGFYGKFMPSTFIYNKLDNDKVKQFMVRQKVAKKHLKNPWAVLLLDDVMDNPKMFNNPLWNGILKMGRHYSMWLIIASQYMLELNPSLRSNIDGVFILREPSLRNRKLLYENFASVVPDFTLFSALMDTVTEDYTALYIHNRSMSNDWRDCVFWYKAKTNIPSDWKFGAKDFWKFHKQRYDQDYKEPLFI